MKNNKTLTIVLIVAAALLVWYFVKKKNTTSTGSTSTGSTSTSSTRKLNTTTTDSIIDGLNLDTSVKNQLKSKIDGINWSESWRASIAEKAAENGITLEKQGVIDGLYLLYQNGIITDVFFNTTSKSIKNS